MRWRAATTAALLSVFFLVVYGGTNWVTSQRSDVGVWVYEWERAIPFIPWMVIPYLSLDLFFVAAPFLCRNRAEVRLLSARIIFSIAVAALCFLLLPLRLTFEPVIAEGWIGRGFEFFLLFDQPYNLFPSLHIALAAVLVAHFVKHTRGGVRIAVVIWFALVGASTLFTHRHHAVDLGGGAVLGMFAIYVFRPTEEVAQHTALIQDDSRVQDDATVRRDITARISSRPYEAKVHAPLAVLYAVGAALCAFTAWWVWFQWGAGVWAIALLWPATSLAIVAMGYAGAGVGVFRKRAGAIAPGARLVLAPVLIGQWLSWLWYSTRSRAWDEVVPRLWIGRRLSKRDATRARRDGLTAVLDLTAESSECASLRNGVYENVQVMDLTAPTIEQIDGSIAFIKQHLQQGNTGAVLVHCKAGYSRSAAIVGAYLLRAGHAKSAADAMTMLRAVRPRIVIRREARAAIESFAARSA